MFVVPVILLITVIVILPLFHAFWISLFDHIRSGIPVDFVGFRNYVKVLTWNRFYGSLFRTAIYTVISNALKLVIGLVTALILNEEFKGRGFLRGVMIIPWTIPVFVVALMWYWMFAWSGMLNAILKALHLQPINWLGPKWAMASVILINVWKGFPFYMLGFLAGLQSIPRDLYEAATVDGASSWQNFVHVTLPGLMPVLLTVLLLSTIWTFSEFTSIYLTTRGGPGMRTETLPILVYTTTFGQFNTSLGAAISIAILPIFLVLIWGTARMMRE